MFIAMALRTLAILWPYQVRFSVSAGEMLAIVREREPHEPVGAQEAYGEVALRYEAMYDLNAKRIRALFWLFRLAIVCLVAEVFAWIGVLQEIA